MLEKGRDERVWTVQLGEEKALRRAWSPFQCLKGLQNCWRGTLEKELERQDKGECSPLAQGRVRWDIERECGYWELDQL